MGNNMFASSSDSAYPASQFFGAQRASMPTGTAPTSSGQDVSKNHIIITGVIVVGVAYVLWHYSMTH